LLVLLVDVVYFSFGVVRNLLHRLFVVALHRINLVFELLDDGLLLLNMIVVVLLRLVDLSLVLLKQRTLRLLEPALLFFLLHEQRGVLACRSEHLIGILLL